MLSKEFVCLFVLGFGGGSLDAWDLFVFWLLYVLVIFTPFFLCQPVPSSGLFVFFIHVYFFWVT